MCAKSFPRFLTKGKYFILQTIALATLSAGQEQVFADSKANSNSVSIHLVGVVPVKLEANFTFTAGNSVDLVGHGSEAFGGFEVCPNKEKGLGFINVKSNLIQGYTITAFSDNNGCMKNLSKDVSVPYSLNIDGRIISSNGGIFTASFSGKSSREGDSKAISLLFGNSAKDISKEVLVDRLTFSISAN